MRIRTWIFVFLWMLFQKNPAAASDPVRPLERVPVEISEQSLFNTLKEMEAWGNRTTWAKQNEVADSLHHRLKKNRGLDVYFHQYKEGNQTYKNVVARIPGKKDPGAVLIFCAHYDSHPAGLVSAGRAPGVDDNATGVAVLLEGARVLAGSPVNNSVELVFFSNEEQGHKGSKAYVKDLTAKGRIIKGVINIDTIGYTQSSWTVLWQEAQGKGSLGKWLYLAKQVLKRPVYYVQMGFKNPNEILRVGGRTANASFVERIYSRLKGADVGIKKDIGPQCG
jgi:Zn-dependent M28 family amino/carboxypeptidase